MISSTIKRFCIVHTEYQHSHSPYTPYDYVAYLSLEFIALLVSDRHGNTLWFVVLVWLYANKFQTQGNCLTILVGQLLYSIDEISKVLMTTLQDTADDQRPSGFFHNQTSQLVDSVHNNTVRDQDGRNIIFVVSRNYKMIERIVVFLGCNIDPLGRVHRHFGYFVVVAVAGSKEKEESLPMSKIFFVHWERKKKWLARIHVQ